MSNVRELVDTIKYNYHLWPATWGPCSNNCGENARGSGLCKNCAEDKLADIVGINRAMELHSAVAALHNIELELTKECP